MKKKIKLQLDKPGSLKILNVQVRSLEALYEENTENNKCH